MDQSYSAEDDLAHIRWLCETFRDPRYIRIEGRPLFLVYRASDLPDTVRTTSLWREEAIRQGVGEPFLCRVESFPGEKGVDPHSTGFDASVEFVPEFGTVGFTVGPTGLRQLDRVLRKARIAAPGLSGQQRFLLPDACPPGLGQGPPELRALPLCDPLVGQQCPPRRRCHDHGRLDP